MFASSAGFAAHYSTIFHPIAGEFDLVGKHPDAEHTIKNVSKYEATTEELKDTVMPELELIESRVLAPVIEFQSVLKLIRKTMTKRDHKVTTTVSHFSLKFTLSQLTDYDRFNNSLTKLRDKKEKSLSDEKNLFKVRS